jgi:hypothetical protein
MTYLKWFKRPIGMALALLLLVGCGVRSAAPKPGAAFSGTINVGNKAGSGSLSFSISEDGTKLINLGTSLQKVNCKDMITMGSVADYDSNPGITITNGVFEAPRPAMGGEVWDYKFNPGDPFPTPVPNPYTIGKITGRFTTPTTASGTITIYLGATMSGGVVCELGTFEWSAKA